MPWPKGRKFSDEHRANISKAGKGKGEGADNPNWRGGVVIENGYKFVRKPSHPNAKKNGYVAEHRLIKSEELGRPLTEGEHVHHVDEIKHHNVPTNLEVKSPSQHTILHNTGRKWSPEVKAKLSEAAQRRYDKEGRNTRICPNCNKEFFPRQTLTRVHCSVECCNERKARKTPKS